MDGPRGPLRLILPLAGAAACGVATWIASLFVDADAESVLRQLEGLEWPAKAVRWVSDTLGAAAAVVLFGALTLALGATFVWRLFRRRRV